jgi:hypothetical protein
VRQFLVGFIAGIMVFTGLNLLAAHLRSDCGLPAILGMARCADDIRRAGFPFIFWEEGGFAYRQIFQPAILAVDLGLALAVSAAAGWVMQRALHRP